MQDKIRKINNKVYYRIFKLILITAILMAVILGLVMESYNYYKDMMVISEQNNILSVATTVAAQMEGYFEKKDYYLREILNEPQFQEEFLKLTQGRVKEVKLIELLFRLQKQEYIALELIDKYGSLLKAYTNDPQYVYNMGEDVKKAIIAGKETYFIEPKGERSINITYPVRIDKDVLGFIRMKLNTNYIFSTYIADYKLNQKGYISLKDRYGRLLFHPSNEGIGEDVVEVRKRQYPNYDWSELESIVERQTNKETGVGTYHSIWPGEGKRVKKISAFTTSDVGDTFFIVNFSLDYKETISGIEGIRNVTILACLLLIATGLVIIGYIYRVEIKKNTLMVETVYLNELKEKNALLMHQSKFAAMGEMLATIAHQLKQPLNALKLSLYNIEDYYTLGENDEDYLKKLMESNYKFIDKMAKTIDDFKFFFKPQYEKLEFNVWEAVNFAIDLNTERINNLEIEVSLRGTQSLTIRGESNVFSQVVLNLLNNAIDAMTEGNGKKYIDIGIEEKEKEVIVEITDNGGGIQQEVQDRLFEPYVTTKGDHGTGLGLYISKNILKEKFNGDLLIENTEEGTKAVIILPKGGGSVYEQQLA
ncbi:Signal transduction histidine kinase regulating C4-dicarboxylate transport system [Geosporobacter subterraneus DSM 17957]|uniref:histidine kinase n=1 Tax=Geosporobacter subterraneus DSM 17957 TaxID=1121919 RepID=A0A1M6MCP3_9FIRM|nr:sensor histidine kinase [Geosporobacter subterraneus]SHJ81278.1 Signal transduction histidine kinase regulating C4-dicarboxylate transport system [Geosporobacter subterraneus DSM 17957]